MQLLYNIPHIFLSSVIGGECFNFGITNVFSRVYSWFSFVLNAIIPFTLLIHMNYVIVKTVRGSHKMYGTYEMGKRQATIKSVENQITTMLLLVTTLFLILLFPTYFRFIYLVFSKRDTPSRYAESMLIFQITSKLYATNSGINFFLYCISGQKFRNDLKEIFCCFHISNGLVTAWKNHLKSSYLKECYRSFKFTCSLRYPTKKELIFLRGKFCKLINE